MSEEIITFEELKLRMKVDARTIRGWRRQGMPCLSLPGIAGMTKEGHPQTRYIWQDVLAWLKAQCQYPETLTNKANHEN